MFGEFQDRPGLLFVVATLLPLASFLLVFLSFGLWAVFRPYRDDRDARASLFTFLGGDSPGRLPAYVALAAIVGAFLSSLGGATTFFIDQGQRHHHAEKVEELEAKAIRTNNAEEHAKAEEEVEEAKKHLADFDAGFNHRWSASFEWLRVRPTTAADSDSGTALAVGFRIDNLNAVMFVMVTFVASLIHLFSIGYMSEELQPIVEDHNVHTEDGHLHRRGRFGRFFLYLSLFCFSMLNLILADNLFQVFVSWELVGICSYLLIGFYFERQSASDAANKAFITNRVGDAGFILGLLIVWSSLGTFNFEEIFRRIRSPEHGPDGTVELAHQFVRASVLPDAKPVEGGRTVKIDPAGSEVVLFPREEEHAHGLRDGQTVEIRANPGARQHGSLPYWMLVAAGLGIFLGCVGKSAQFPLHVWLPDAMEGPTPVSALIHAATMVAAGVYLVGRCYPMFTPEALLVIAYTGGITLFVAATVAVVMTDIKKVLAYSTVSQLGYMMLALGVGGWTAGLFHLLTHAFFKALLFLGSGSVIYGCHHEQDMRKMGGLFPKMKITALTMLFGVLAIAGIPLFSGWYSKDSILAQALGFSIVHPQHLILFLLPLMTAGITTFYMFRMWYLTFAGTPRDHHVYDHATESPALMTGPLVALAVLSVAVAWGWPIWDAKASWLEHQLHHAQPVSVVADFGHILSEGENFEWATRRTDHEYERQKAHEYHEEAGAMALGVVGLGIVFASLLYLYRILDPDEAKQQAGSLFTFLWHKWYFDELYSVILVRPSLAVAHAFKWFDLTVIDGIIHGVARSTLRVSRWDGRFDSIVVDGLVNLVGNVTFRIGSSFRGIQTGALRSYVLFLALAAVGLFVVLSYFVTFVFAG
jgi:NADH-quinone oxidoreductase subunit L